MGRMGKAEEEGSSQSESRNFPAHKRCSLTYGGSIKMIIYKILFHQFVNLIRPAFSLALILAACIFSTGARADEAGFHAGAVQLSSDGKDGDRLYVQYGSSPRLVFMDPNSSGLVCHPTIWKINNAFYLLRTESCGAGRDTGVFLLKYDRLAKRLILIDSLTSTLTFAFEAFYKHEDGSLVIRFFNQYGPLYAPAGFIMHITVKGFSFDPTGQDHMKSSAGDTELAREVLADLKRYSFSVEKMESRNCAVFGEKANLLAKRENVELCGKFPEILNLVKYFQEAPASRNSRISVMER